MKKIYHKFGAKACKRREIKFPSLLERSVFDYLETLQKSKRIWFFLRQIPFDLPGGAKHVVDFMVVTRDEVLFVEAKGRDLPLGKMKRLQTEELYNIEILVVKGPYDLYDLLGMGNYIPGEGKTLC